MYLPSAADLGCYYTYPPKHFLIVRGWLGDFDASLPFFPDRPTNAQLGGGGANLVFIVASCLPENPDILRLNVAGHCPAVKSTDVAAREGLQRGGGSHPCTLLLSYCPL